MEEVISNKTFNANLYYLKYIFFPQFTTPLFLSGSFPQRITAAAGLAQPARPVLTPQQSKLSSMTAWPCSIQL